MIVSRMREYKVEKPRVTIGSIGDKIITYIPHPHKQSACIYPAGDGISKHEYGERASSIRIVIAPTSTVLRKRWRVRVPTDDGEIEVYSIISYVRTVRECVIKMELDHIDYM